MTSKRHSFSNLKCNGAKLRHTKRKPRILLPKSVQHAKCFGYLLLALCLSCTLPEAEIPQPGSTPATGKGESLPLTGKRLIEKLASNREREAPPILGIRYIETIGRAGQGVGEFRAPMGLTIDERQWIYVADAGNNRIQVIDSTGRYITEFGSRGWQTGEFDHPTDIALSFQRSYRLYVTDTGNDRVQYCNFVDQIFYPLSESVDGVLLDRPEGIGIGRNGEVYVVDTGNHRWIEFNVAGVPVVAHGGFGSGREQLWNPTDLGIDSHGNVYVVDADNHLIKKYDFSGNPINTWGGEGDELGRLQDPKRIDLDEWNYLYVTDSGNRRIQVFTPDGKRIVEFSTPELLQPAGITVSKTGRIFVSDAEANDIKVFQVFYKK